MRWIDAVAAVSVEPQRRSVMISAGHDDRSPGAAAHGHTEADIVLELRELISAELSALGIEHALDGEPGENLPLREAVAIAAEHDIALELHCNAATPAATGVETLSRPEMYPLGRTLCQAVVDALGIDDRGAKPEGSGQHSRLAFVSGGGGLILELFFLTNKRDLATYLARKRRLARALAEVVAEAAR